VDIPGNQVEAGGGTILGCYRTNRPTIFHFIKDKQFCFVKLLIIKFSEVAS